MKINKNTLLLAGGLIVGFIALKYIIVEGYYQKKAAEQEWTVKREGDDDDAYQGRITLSS
ncbi:MAG TPA: hypothetical protein VF433_07530 [Cellvibrio sp.]